MSDVTFRLAEGFVGRVLVIQYGYVIQSQLFMSDVCEPIIRCLIHLVTTEKQDRLPIDLTDKRKNGDTIPRAIVHSNVA